MSVKWVLVADSASARVLQWERGELREVESYAHRPSRDHNQDLMGNRPNQNQHSMETTAKGDEPQSMRDDESRVFARQLAGMLGRAHGRRRFEELIIIADPRFLGMLRAELPAPVRRATTDSFDQRANERSPAEIAELIGP